MAKKKNGDLDDLDLDDLGLDDDLDMFNDSDDSFSDKPKKNRSPVLNAVSDGFDGFKSNITDDAMKTASDIAEAAIPTSLSNEKSEIDNTVATLKEEILNATKEVRQAGASAVNAVDKLIPDDSALKKYSGKLLGLLSSNNDSSVVEEISKDQKQNMQIAESILSTLGEQSKADLQSTAIKEQIASYRHKSSQEIMAGILVNTQKNREFNSEITNAYYRRSLELQYKSLFTAKEQLDVVKAGFNNFTNQFESIIKNTGLPDIVKLKTTEQLGENIGFKARENIANFVYNDLNPFKNLRENATNKIKSAKDNLLESLGMVTEVGDGLGMMREMESFGMSKSNIAGSSIADWLKGKTGEYLSSKIEDSERGKDSIYKIKNAMLNPEQFLLDRANEQDTSTTFGSLKSNAMTNIADLFSKKDKNDLLTLNKNNPDEPAIFDYRVHNSIVKTIPGLLSKIYSEVRGIRTGEDPSSNELHYDNVSDTFKTKGTLKQEFKNNASKTISNNIGAPLISFFSRLVPSGKKLDKNKEQLLSNALLQYLMETKNTAPDGLLNGTKNLLTYLPKSMHKQTTSMLKTMLGIARDEPYVLDSISSDLKRIITGIPTFAGATNELYKSGLKSVSEDIGLLKTNDVTGKSILDKDNVIKFVLDNHNEFGIDKIRADINEREKFNAKYGIKSQDAIIEAQRKLEEEKRLNPKTKKTVEDFLKEQQQNLVNSSAYKTTKDKISELDTKYNVSNTAKDYYNTNLNSLAGKIENDVIEKINNNEYIQSAKKHTTDAIDSLNKNQTVIDAKQKMDSIDKKFKISRKSKLYLKKMVKTFNDSETVKTLEAEIDKIKNLEELKEFNSKLEENKILNDIKESLNGISNRSLNSNLSLAEKKIKRSKRKAELGIEKIKKQFTASDIKKDVDLIIKEANGDPTKVLDIIKNNNLDIKYQDQVNILYDTAVKYSKDNFTKLNSKYNNFTNQQNSIKVNMGTLTPNKIENLNRLAPANNIKFIPKELKEISDEEENEYRIVYLNADIDRDVVSFEDYLKSFGLKPKDSLLNKLNFIKGLKDLYNKQFNKKLEDNVDKGVKLVKLKKVNKDEEETLRFEFYNSPEYKAGLITDFQTWLKDKGLRNEDMLSLKSILRKTREWDKKIFKATVGTGLKMVKNIPWAAKNSLSLAGKAISPFTTLGKYALDGALSTVGLDFMGIGDKGTRGLDKKAVKKAAELAKASPSGLSKMFNLFGKGASKAKGLDWGILNPFNSLQEKDIDSEKFNKKYQKKLDREKRIAELKEKREKKKEKNQKAFNDSDGDGLRDGDFRSRFSLFNKKKEPKSNIPAPEKSDGDKSMFSMFQMLAMGIPALLGVAKNMFSKLELIPDILKWIGKGVFNIPNFLKSIGSKILKLPSLISGAISMGSGLLESGSKLVTSAVETGAKVVSGTSKTVGTAISNVTPESVKAFFGKIKDMIIKKLGPKAGGKLMLSFGAKTASRLVPVTGLALLTYDAAMITADMLKNNTDFKSAVSKQLLGFDIFNPDEPALDEDGNPIKPDEKFTKEDMAEKLSDKEKEKLVNEEGNGKTDKDWFDKMYDSVSSASSDMYNKAKEMGSNAIDYTKDSYNAVKNKAGQIYNDTKDTVAKAYDSTKKALGGLVGSIPFPTGNGSWNALKETIVSASKAAGVDDKLMAIMAAVESGFNYTVKAGTSSAKGLYQFLDSTWNNVVKQFGSKYGIDSSVPSTDPRANALMGAEFMKQNAETIRSEVSRPLTYTDIYLAHFLGPAGAKKFLKELEKDPNQNASVLFPAPAAANKNIFYVGGDTSKPRSLGAIYSHFTNLLNNKAKSFNIDVGGDTEPSKQTIDSNAVAQTTQNNTSSNSTAEVVNANSTNVNQPVYNTQPNTSNSSSTTNNNLGSYTDKVSLSNTENAMNSSNALADSNKILTGISGTLTESLKVQIRIADALDKISSFDTKNREISKDEIASNIDKSNVNNVNKTSVNNTEFIEPAINLERKKY